MTGYSEAKEGTKGKIREGFVFADIGFSLRLGIAKGIASYFNHLAT